LQTPRLISLIVPDYKQEKIIVANVKKLLEAMNKLAFNFEIIVIVDGNVDKTYDNISKFKSTKVRSYKYEENQGKGYAVKFGGEKAKGDIVGFIDAGMDIDPTGLSMLLNHMIWYDADIIVGSKLHPVSQVNYPLYRKILSWGYRTFTSILF
jgi:glycosyltransferase involved in cell wall biosynthesis